MDRRIGDLKLGIHTAVELWPFGWTLAFDGSPDRPKAARQSPDKASRV